MVAAHEETIDQRVIVVMFNSSLRKCNGLRNYLTNLLWNICVKIYQGYIMFVVIHVSFFRHPSITTELLTRVTQRMPLVHRAVLALQEHFLVGFMLLNLVFSV